MALYRRMNDAEGADAVEALAAEMIDRFGPLPAATENLVQLIQIKRQAIEAHIAKIDVGPRGTLVAFHNDPVSYTHLDVYKRQPQNNKFALF